MSEETLDSPWMAGAKAVRDNAWPSLFILIASASLVVSYYQSDVVRSWLDVLGNYNRNNLWSFAALCTAFSAGFIPWCFRMAFPSIRPAHPWLDLIHSVLWWALMGIIVCAFYQLQAEIFGHQATASTVFKKVLFDQFFFTVFIGAPFNAISHYWKDHAWDFSQLKVAMRPGWYRRLIVPNLLPNYLVWFPGACIFYSMPGSLQLPVANCIGCFWALMCVRIATHSRPRI